jgi:aromatic-amino-acid transaminase
MSIFDKVPMAPADPILGLTAAFSSDPRKNKVNLGVGLYKGEDLLSPIMTCVKSAEGDLMRWEKSKEYSPIEGDHQFIGKTGELVFGSHFWGTEFERIAGFQTVGGTGALRIGAAFIKQEAENTVYISHPTWPNHRGVFHAAGLKVENYPYYDVGRHQLQFDMMIEYLTALPSGSVILLHASCHNPTGIDLNREQWLQVADLCQKRGLVPFFDCAYQGFGRGLTEDVQSIRLFAEKGMEMIVAFSLSKNFSLYGERVGALFIVTPSLDVSKKVTSRVKQVIRTLYSNPPIHGARIVAHVLSEHQLREVWERQLREMCERINAMRHHLVERLKQKSHSADFNHLDDCKGMFCYSGLSSEQVERIISEFGVYMTGDGRINVCGLNRENLDYVAESILAVKK